MERFNPFAGSSEINHDEDQGFSETTSADRSNFDASGNRKNILGSSDSMEARNVKGTNVLKQSISNATGQNRYSTSFPDPFGELDVGGGEESENSKTNNASANRSNSVTFASQRYPLDSSESTSTSAKQALFSGHREPGLTRTSSHRHQTGGLTSFLSRATSVTSSSVSDRVSGAVGSVRSAVDSISNQLQQAVPTNINERISSTATNLIGTSEQSLIQQSQQMQQQSQQPQSAASYLASKISSATGQFTSSAPSLSSMPVIGRQRVILILDSLIEVDWAQQFKEYRRLISGSKSGTQSTLSSFFSSATAQLTASSSSTVSCDGFDLVEQADYKDVSVLSNQATLTATVYVSNGNNSASRNNRNSAKILRPEYVVVRQRSGDLSGHLKNVIMALDFCAVPMFEPLAIWNIFQDRQLVFSKLLRVKQTLGKEIFPLIPKIYCQTHQDLINYLNSSTVTLPCLIRTGASGKGKIKINNLQTLRNFSSIVETSCLSCTIEQYLDVKCDLIIQKLGTSLKLFKRNVSSLIESQVSYHDSVSSASLEGRQSRQSSMSSSVLSSFIPSTSSNQQQQQQQQQNQLATSNSRAFERLSEVNGRYKEWVDAIMREFDNKLIAFCIKVVVTTDDREYIVGLRDCSMEFLGNTENQEEDRRSFVELVTGDINTILPKNALSRESSLNTNVTNLKLASGEDSTLQQQQPTSEINSDKKKFSIQTQINDGKSIAGKMETSGRSFGQLSNRSHSVSVNHSNFGENEQNSPNQIIGNSTRRGSDRSNDSIEGLSRKSSNSGLQSSLGQSFLDQTSTALSSFQKQSMSFFKRLDSRSNDFGSNTPPLSATSDKGFSRTSGTYCDEVSTKDRDGFKSQSVDGSSLDRSRKRDLPPKPPPPQLYNRQSSLASYSSTRSTANVTPNSTPVQTRQNSTAITSGNNVANQNDGSRVTRVIRQNSALSAFEPYDPYLTSLSRSQNFESIEQQQQSNKASSIASETFRKPSDATTKRGLNFDSASVTSGDSNSTNETATAEDTMNNLKKTFASIFGDKCE